MDSSDESQVVAVYNSSEKKVHILKVGKFKIVATKNEDKDYKFQTIQSDIITVKAKPVSLEGIEVYDKIYDGNKEAQISKNPTILGNIDGENLSVAIGKAYFGNETAGQNKTVFFENFSLEGKRASNYTLISQPDTITANIEKRAVNIEGLSALGKTYDGNTTAKTTTDYEITNLVDGETIDIEYGKANFADKNVGNSKVVTFSEFGITGSNSANYFLKSQPKGILANIEPKGVDVVNININSKVYDRTNKATFKSNPELSGVIAGDDITLINGNPSFSSIAVSNSVSIEFTAFSIKGADSKNYYLNGQLNGVTAEITPKNLKIANLKVKDKTFDGDNTAEFEIPPTLEGVIKPDEVTLSISTPTFSSKEAGKNIPIIFTPEFSISGKDSSNYFLEPHPDITANINIATQLDNQSNTPSEPEQQKSITPEPNDQNDILSSEHQKNVNSEPDDNNDIPSSEQQKDATPETDHIVFSQQDSNSKVWVEAPAGVFPKNSKLIVQTLNYDPEEYEKVLEGLDEDKKQTAERLKLFEIHVINSDGDIIQPTTDYGLVTVRIPIPDDFDKDDLEVYRVLFDLPDSEFDEYVVTIDNKHYCEFKTDHFSPYALIDKKSDNNFSKIIIVVSILILLIMIAILLFILFKRNKDENQNSNQLNSSDD